ncbi:hypothetical protein JD77_04888 [Micromonospora olivasterospora]|uniref:Uncharacterized protein n=1 Tax=Micromonospora olivasterospora TaxID=1880 RepID=A0A562IGJ1_MICOL|nr:hypothetical protein JD77_04888 [Micromonospora olivasterospora]
MDAAVPCRCPARRCRPVSRAASPSVPPVPAPCRPPSPRPPPRAVPASQTPTAMATAEAVSTAARAPPSASVSRNAVTPTATLTTGSARVSAVSGAAIRPRWNAAWLSTRPSRPTTTRAARSGSVRSRPRPPGPPCNIEVSALTSAAVTPYRTPAARPSSAPRVASPTAADSSTATATTAPAPSATPHQAVAGGVARPGRGSPTVRKTPSPPTPTTEASRSRRAGRRRVQTASTRIAMNSPLAISGWTSASGPNRRASAWRPMPAASGSQPNCQRRVRRSRSSSRGSSGPTRCCRFAARCCIVVATARQKAPARAHATARITAPAPGGGRADRRSTPARRTRPAPGAGRRGRPARRPGRRRSPSRAAGRCRPRRARG